jgi:hypothetical protein
MKSKKGISVSTLLVSSPVVIEGIDGRMYCGRSLSEAVNAMRNGSWGIEAASLKGYMKQVAKRVYGWSKARISIRSLNGFVRDLVKAGIIVVHNRRKS